LIHGGWKKGSALLFNVLHYTLFMAGLLLLLVIKVGFGNQWLVQAKSSLCHFSNT
jgi:hypothetical protein